MLLPATVRVSSDVLFQDMGEDVVLLNMATEQYYGAPGVAARMWHLLSEDGSTARTLSAIMTEYAVDRETAERDLAAFVGRLADAGLVTAQG